MKPQPRYQRGDRIAKRYRVHQALLGGMGEVYLCLDLEENYPYALKTFQQRYLTDAQRLRRAFEQEVLTWVAFEKHPNIVRCFYAPVLDNQPFMVLEWIAGEEGKGTDLRSWLRHGPLDLKLTLEIAIDICHGLLHAQAKRPGLVHRDLKPENILITQGGLAKITDFGLAQIVQTAELVLDDGNVTNDGRQSMTGGKGIAGTPAYMAPEQWRGEPLDERTDIYALGCILHELLTGKSPFAGDFTPTTPQQWQRWLATVRHAHETFPYAPRPEADAPALQELLAACLAKAPADRPARLADLLTRLTRLYQMYVVQPPPSRPVSGMFTVNDYYNRGTTYVELGQHAQALADFDCALILDPNLAEAYHNRGATYHALGQHVQALADYDRAIELDPNFALAHNSRGNTYAALGQHAQALADYNRAIELNPNYAEAYYNRGNTYALLEQHVQALADYDRAIELDPSLAKAYSNRGVTYAALGQHAQALADYDRAIELDLNFAKAYSNRGVTYAALGQHAQALADYNRAIELDPNDALAYLNSGALWGNQGHHTEALPYFEKAAQLGDPRGAQSAAQTRQRLGRAAESPVNAAQQAFDALGQHTAALADYTRAIELDPSDATAHYNRGNTYRDLQEYAAALADYTQALALNPNDASTYNNRGKTYADLGQHRAALADYIQALVIDPNHTTAYANRGIIYHKLGQHQAALADYNYALTLDPNNATTYNNRGISYHELGQYAAALADYNDALVLNPSYATAYVNRGSLHHVLQEYEAALADYTEASKISSTLATAYANRGVTYHELGQHEAALADYTYALTLNPNDAQTYVNRGNTYADMQDYTAALADFTQAIELNSTDAQTYFNRGLASAALEDLAAALADFTRSLELDPTNTTACLNIGALLSNQGRLAEALPYFEKAAQLGEPKGTQYIAQVRARLSMESGASMDTQQKAWIAFAEADTLATIQQAVTLYPLLRQPDFITAIEQVIAEQAPPEQRPAFLQRLTWLHQLAKEQNP